MKRRSTRGDAGTAAELRRLRLRIMGLNTLVAATVVVVSSAVAIRLDRDLRREQIDADLLRSTSRAASEVVFEDGLFEADQVRGLDSDVVVGIRPSLDPLTVAEQRELWDQIPEMSEHETVERLIEVVDELDPHTMADLLDIEVPIDEEVMWERLVDDPPDDVYDEALRSFIVDVAHEQGIDLGGAIALYGPLADEIGVPVARDAVRLVADEHIEETFEVDARAAVLLARGVRLRDGAEIRGAVLALTDPTASEASHRRFSRIIASVGVALIAVAAGAAWLVAGRSVRPAARALAQQERFLADAAHELRTPIAAIRAVAEAPSRSTNEPVDAPSRSGDRQSRLDRVAELAGAAGQLTDDLLTLARMDADGVTLRIEPVRLDLLAEAAVDADPSFRLEVSESIVEADPGLLERAIANLLANARRHGGATPDTPATVIVEGEQLRVADNGPGVAEEDRESIFQRFSSGPASSGHGLGLPLARWIARAHGGELTLVPGGSGATFELSLRGGGRLRPGGTSDPGGRLRARPRARVTSVVSPADPAGYRRSPSSARRSAGRSGG